MVSTDGSIYLVNSKGYLVALKAGVVVPTPVPTNTLQPNPTHNIPTDTPVASIPTFTPSPSPLPGTTYSPTPTPKGSSGSGSGGGSSSTTTSNFFNQGSGGTTGSTAKPGTPTPGKPGAKSTGKPGSTKGVTSGKAQDLVIHIAAGSFGVGNMSVLHLTTKPGAKINYTVKTSYTFPAKPKTTAKKQTPPSKKKQGISTTFMARGIVPSTAANPGPYARVAAFSPAAEARRQCTGGLDLLLQLGAGGREQRKPAPCLSAWPHSGRSSWCAGLSRICRRGDGNTHRLRLLWRQVRADRHAQADPQALHEGEARGDKNEAETFREAGREEADNQARRKTGCAGMPKGGCHAGNRREWHLPGRPHRRQAW